MALAVFIPLPFLGITAFECISDDPIDLIEAIKSAATNFNEAHKDSNPKFDNVTKGAKLFMSLAGNVAILDVANSWF
jgi:hypothetical protein